MKIKKIFHENLFIKIISVNSVVVVLRLIFSLFIQRCLALTVGEIGIAKIGQLKSITSILSSLTISGTFNGIVKHVAIDKNNPESLSKLFSTVFVFSFVSCFIISPFLYFNSTFLSDYIFSSFKYAFVFKLLSIFTPIIALNRIISAIINGLSKYKLYSKAYLLFSLISGVVLLISLYKFELKGVLFAVSIESGIHLIILLVLCLPLINKYKSIFQLFSFKTPYAKTLLAFTLMSITSNVILNYVEIEIRLMIENEIGEKQAGYWTGITNISKNYMLFSSTLFTMYILPKISKANSFNKLNNELRNIYKILIPVFGTGMLFVYIFRDLVIDIVYPNFVEMSSLFSWQLLGDFFKLIGLVIIYLIISKKMVWSYIIIELISQFSFYYFSSTLIYHHGVEGVVMSHFFRFLLILIILVFIYIKYIKKSYLDK